MFWLRCPICRVRPRLTRPESRGQLAHQHRQGRLAGAIDPDQTDPHAGPDQQLRSSSSTPVLVNPGTYVTEGTALATVSSPDFAEAVATYSKAQTALKNAARIATLDEQLFQANAIAKNDLEQARADSASAVADREAAIAQMVALGVDSTTIEAIREGKPVPLPSASFAPRSTASSSRSSATPAKSSLAAKPSASPSPTSRPSG